MSNGITTFAQNQQGWSFVAVRAPVERVAEALAGRAGVVRHERDVRPEPMEEEAGIRVEHERRHAFLLQMKVSDWAALVLTVHWFQNSDALFATLLAADLSEALCTKAVAAWDDDFSGATAIVCDKGRKSAAVSDEEDTDAFDALFDDEGLSLPECFISAKDDKGGGDDARLLVADPSEVERADYFLLTVPEAFRSGVPHVFEKLGMMAEAVGAGEEGDEEGDFPEDESEFRSRMVDGIWKQAEARRRARGN
ncbi:MAG TPA: hypothetical protein VGI81_17020 [Tepidisphaeraceae bacterium]